jgi:hypothetical protein
MARPGDPDDPGEDEVEEAFRWDGESDPSHVAGPKAAKQRREARGDDGEADDATLAPVTSSALLVTYGILGGVYLLYSIGWIISVTRSVVTLPTLLAEIMYQFGEFLAIAAPALWFFSVFVLTRGRRPIVRLVWLLVGLVVLLPLRFVLGVR